MLFIIADHRMYVEHEFFRRRLNKITTKMFPISPNMIIVGTT